MTKPYTRLPPKLRLDGKVVVRDSDKGPVKTGGFGAIYKGTLGNETLVAVKVPHTHVINNPKTSKGLAGEMETWSRTNHKNVQALLGYCTDLFANAPFCFVSPWMENGNARDFIEKHPTTNRITLLKEIADGLTYLHKEGIIHGDIRGSNILIGLQKEALVSNFGLSRYDAGVSGSSSLNGHPRWQPPEWSDPQPFKLTAEQCHARPLDVWSFGMTILELVAGQDPYPEIHLLVQVAQKVAAGILPHRPAAFVDNEMWSLCLRIWQRNPDNLKRPAMYLVSGELTRIEHSPDVPEAKTPFWGDLNITGKALQDAYDAVFEGHRLLEANGPLLVDHSTQRKLLRERSRWLVGSAQEIHRGEKLREEATKFHCDVKHFIATAKRKEPPADPTQSCDVQHTDDEVFQGHRRLEVNGPLLVDRSTHGEHLREPSRIENENDDVLFEERPVVYQHLLRSLTVTLHNRRVHRLLTVEENANDVAAFCCLSARYIREDALLRATERMLKYDTVRSVTESQEYRMQLLDVWSRSGVPEHSIITEAILKDDAEISSLLYSILLSGKKDELSRIVGEDAEKFMHVIQTVIHSNPPWLSEDSNASREAYQLLVQLYKAAELFPTELLITGVEGHQQHVISSGGFADVFQATFRGTGVALKRFRIFLNQSCEERRKVHRMIAKEASIWKELRHRHLLPFLGIDLETFPGFMCLVSPWMRNGTLNDYLKSNLNIYIDKLLFEVAQGVEYLHSENVVHGDLRGTNILIDDERCARLADLGLASLTETATQSTNQRGSTRWMAPELLSPEQFDLRFQRTFATDVYAFACVILEVYSGRSPFADVASDIEVALTVISGNRPKRPSGQVQRPIPNNMWRLVTECWSLRNSQRPTIASVVTTMKRSHFAQTTY